MKELEGKLKKRAISLAQKAQGLPDKHKYSASNGETWIVNDLEYDFLNNAKELSQKDREKVVTRIGSGTVDSDGNRRMFVITGTGLLIAAGVGAAAKGVAGWWKRRKQDNALAKAADNIKKRVAEVQKQKKKGYETSMTNQQLKREHAELTKNTEFEAFADAASKSIIPEGAMVQKSKGLKTGAVDKTNIVGMYEAKKAAETKNKLSVMAQTNLDRSAVADYDRVTSAAKSAMASLDASRQNIQAQRDNLSSWTNVLDDTVQGASLGLKLYTSMGTGGNTGTT